MADTNSQATPNEQQKTSVWRYVIWCVVGFFIGFAACYGIMVSTLAEVAAH